MGIGVSFGFLPKDASFPEEPFSGAEFSPFPGRYFEPRQTCKSLNRDLEDVPGRTGASEAASISSASWNPYRNEVSPAGSVPALALEARGMPRHPSRRYNAGPWARSGLTPTHGSPVRAGAPRKAPRFALRFPARMIPVLAQAYDHDPRAAFEAGRRIAPGSRDRQDLMAIFEWKTRGRGRSRPARNTDAEIADALDLATAARTDRAAVAVLTGLAGVDVPVASAILTAVDPQRFTIIDFRALWSLGIERAAYYPVGFYLDYLAASDRGGCPHQSAHSGQRALALLKAESATGRLIVSRAARSLGPSERQIPPACTVYPQNFFPSHEPAMKKYSFTETPRSASARHEYA
jgi:hypothetical protein